MDGFINKMPNWVRWVGFLPVAFIFWFISYPIILSLNMFLEDSFWGYLFGMCAGSCVGAYGFIWIGTKMAPGYKIMVTVFLVALFLCFIGWTIVGFLRYETDVVPWKFYLVVLISVLASLSAAHDLIKNKNKQGKSF